MLVKSWRRGFQPRQARRAGPPWATRLEAASPKAESVFPGKSISLLGAGYNDARLMLKGDKLTVRDLYMYARSVVENRWVVELGQYAVDGGVMLTVSGKMRGFMVIIR